MAVDEPIDNDPLGFVQHRLRVHDARLPGDLSVELAEDDMLGKGKNNRVFSARYRGQPCVLRAPRRRSDTQERGSALCEAYYSLLASKLGVGPKVYAAWWARHAHDGQPSGLYLVTEAFDMDLETYLTDPEHAAAAAAHVDEVAAAVLGGIETLAKHRFFLYDLKPSNVVLRLGRDGRPSSVRLIDFGRDFCEAPCDGLDEVRTPHLTLLDRLVERHGKASGSESSDMRGQRAAHVLTLTMLVQLASTTTKRLRDTRLEHRLSQTQRQALHGLPRIAKKLIDGTQARNLRLVRALLRSDDVRGVLRHYHGRRCAGTRRTLRYARGVE